ncbi:hypothetical protein RJT34_16306 [Clitoria ternatea]|uniref:Uncharacterized protein n=1 Tax=Clitoria ternatea TaxID=43366 RepID=A0AAN9J886_CLITE
MLLNPSIPLGNRHRGMLFAGTLWFQAMLVTNVMESTLQLASLSISILPNCKGWFLECTDEDYWNAFNEETMTTDDSSFAISGLVEQINMTKDLSDYLCSRLLQEMTNGSPIKVADGRLNGAVDEEELMRALKVSFWCI